MNPSAMAGGPRARPHEGVTVAAAVKLAAAQEYANWGGEFVDDAFRFGEQPLPAGDDPLEELGMAG